MRWIRTHRRLGSRLALFALAVQLVVSFGHVHLDKIAPSSAAASAVSLLDTALLPHGVDWHSGIQMASLDHAMWFHHTFRVDDWLLYSQDSPSASGARGFNRGAVYARDGKLVASVVQEGLMRQRPERKA